MAWYYPGACKVDFVKSEEHLLLPSRTKRPKKAFPEICKDITPSCYLNPFLFNGHLQTAWTVRKPDGPLIYYKRRVFESEEESFPGHFAVDFVVDPPAEAPLDTSQNDNGKVNHKIGLTEDPTGIGHVKLPPRTTYFSNEEFEGLKSDNVKPLLVMLPGLSGGSYEAYIRHVIGLLIEHADPVNHGLTGSDWEVLVCNSRGCAGSKITTPLLYNARSTWDIRNLITWCRETWPNRPIFAVGFSIGANILTNYLGEEGSDSIINAACIVANPWDLTTTHKALHRSIFGHNMYSTAMGESMKHLVEVHQDVMAKNPALDMDKIRNVKQLFEFDREVQCATWGYPTETAYYRDASSTDAVLAIRVPTFALHALDDPIACDESVPYEEIRMTPYVVMATTSRGGHLSWFEWSGQRWHAKPIVAYFRAMADISFSSIGPPEMPAKGKPGGLSAPFEFSSMNRKAKVTSNKHIRRALSYTAKKDHDQPTEETKEASEKT